MDIQRIRQDFPLLARPDAPLYFDSACQSLRPAPVIEAVSKYYHDYPACAGRSSHRLADKVTQKVAAVRQTVACFIGAKPDEIIFTRNTTEGINLVARSFGLKRGDVVLLGDKEHNSNLIVWQILKSKIGINYKIVKSRPDNTFDLEAYATALTSEVRVRLVSIVYTSNLNGVTNPIGEIVKIAHRQKVKVLVDGAQTAPHQPIDVKKLDVDWLAFSGHKLLGPSGTGVLYGKYKLLEELEPFLVGGETVARSTYTSHQLLLPPEKFEAGLQDYAGIIGLGAAIDYLQQIGLNQIQRHDRQLNQLTTQLLSAIPGVKIIGPASADERGSILSFYVADVDSHQIALILDQNARVAVRSGQFCVHSWFDAHRISGAVRVSFYLYNSESEVKKLANELEKILKVLR